MCRWLAYSGSPLLLEELLLKPAHSLIDQSLHSKLGATTTNGDGFGLGWYGAEETPGIFHSTDPAWNNHNLRELAQHLTSRLVFAHIRASTGTAVQRTNCHPFRYGRWLWMHNGAIREFRSVKRDLAFAVDPSLYPLIEGSTDTELFFYLALSTDGNTLWSFRYSSERNSRSLFYSTDVETLRAQYPDHPVLHNLSAETRLVVSEPLGDLAGVWNELPEATCAIVQQGQDELRPFTPRSA
jgi:glutamine amidotransferase